MMDYDWLPDVKKWRSRYIYRENGRVKVRFIEDHPLPKEWEVDKTIRPVVD